MSPFLRASVRGVLFGAAVTSGAAVAAPQAADTTEIAEVVIVTGSYIRGTPEDAALPVEVISSEELEKQGAPSTLDLLKQTPVMTGIIGESNQFTAGRGQAAMGSASINLRGFGAARTLVLLNGKRMASEDANLLPAAAIGRVEILKDGGAATYGSDAIGGVVNFITKERVNGLELGGDYRYIDGSDGDYTASLAWGVTGDRSDLFVSAEYFHRSELRMTERDWALRSRDDNPFGGWSTGSNPGAFRFLTTTGLTDQAHDPACEVLGGAVVGIGGGNTQCQTQYTPWDNLVEDQDSYRLFAQYNLDIGDSTQLHVEGLYAFTDVPESHTSPSYTTTRRLTSTATGPGGFFLSDEGGVLDPARSPFFIIPMQNPGFLAARDAGLIPANAVRGLITLNQWRPFMAGGNPSFGYGASISEFERQQSRFSAELTGELADMNWTVSATYGTSRNTREESDIATGKLQYALRGLGGPNCDVAANTPGENGCLWFNPFSSAVAGNPLTGAVNPGFDPDLANSIEVINWMQDRHKDYNEGELAEVNAVLSGEMGLSLPGGAIGWAGGVQYRHQWNKSWNNQYGSNVTNPCPDTPINGDTSCFPFPESPYNFLATYSPSDLDRGVYAVFGEVNLPVTDSFNAQIATRFEDYGSKGGSSFDPKLSLRWQATDVLAFRGSVSTTFRAPPQGSLIEEEAIAFQSVLGSNRPVGTVGNADLEPEEAFTFSVGTMLNVGNFRAMVDFWRFDIEKLLGVEPSGGILELVFPNGADPTAANNCATVDPQWLDAHFDFTGGVCNPNNILKLTRSQINGAGLVNDGVDVTMDYEFDNVFGGSLIVGATGTWIHKYETETLVIDGVVFEEGFDGVGFLNQTTSLYALPEWRAQGYLDYSYGDHNVRWTANFVDQYRDQRFEDDDRALVDSTILHNITFRTFLPWDTTLLATVENVFDEDPSFAYLEMNYDPLTGSPLGRTFKIGLRKSFQ